MDNASASAAPVTYPVFAAVALGITGSSVYHVIDLVGGMFEQAGAVFEGSPDAPGTLLALLPPSDRAAVQAVQLGLQAQAVAPTLRIGVDATEVHTKQEQDARWQQVIDRAITLQKAARTGEVVAGEHVEPLTHGAVATQALRVGEDTYLLLTGVRDLAAVPPVAAEPVLAEPVAPEPVAPEPVETVEPDEAPSSSGAAELAPPSAEQMRQLTAEQIAPERITHEPVAVPTPDPLPIPLPEQPTPEPALAATSEPMAMSTATTPAVATATMHASARWDGRLVGREEQLAELGSRFERVVAERSAACVLVTGDPGSGRSRLIRAFVDGCDPGTRSLSIACDPTDAGGSRWPLAGLLEAFADLGPAAASDDVARRLGTLFEGQPDADRVLPQLLAMLALDGRVEADEVRWALRRAIEAATRDTPTIVHIDDADRAGAGFVRLLADVAASSDGAPILFVLTSRRESDAVPAVRVAALDPEAAAELVAELLGAVEPGLDVAVAARANGDPFLVEQILATLTESGTLAPGQGRWAQLADLATVPLPDGPIGVVRRRLQSLPPHTLAVLGVAAVAGERFAATPLADVLPDEAAAAMAQHLADLVARGFLIDVGDGSFRFRHALIREATMGGVPDWARAAMHRRVARDLEQRAGERMWRAADAIGDHLAAACELTPDASTADRDEAIGLLTWSASAALEQGDLDGAARAERRAAGLLDHDPVQRAELLYLAAEHGAAAAPDRPADREIAEAGLAASVAGDDLDWRVRLLRARLRTTAGHEDALEAARATADEAIAAFDEGEMTWALSSAWALRGRVHSARAQNGLVAEDLLRAADHAAAAGRFREETRALRGAAAALLDGPNGVEEAEVRCRSFLDRVRGPLAEHDVRSAVALLQARRSAFEDARATIGPSIAALETLGAARELAIVLHRGAEIEVLAGQPQGAEPHLQRAMAAAANARDEGLRSCIAGAFAHILVHDDGRLDEALALADLAETHAADIPANVAWRMARARVLVRRGRGDQAERLVREGLSLAEQTDSTDLRANTLVYAADVRRRAGRPAEAVPFERRALRLFERRGATAQASEVAAILRPDESEVEIPIEPPIDPSGRAEQAAEAEGQTPEPSAPPSHPDPMEATLASPDRAMTPGAVRESMSEGGATFVAAPDEHRAGHVPGPVEAPPSSTPQSAADGSARRWFNR